MTDQKIKVGDVVTLKSGGPKMTVAIENEGNMGNTFVCEWFYQGEVKKSTFNPETLSLTER